MAVILYNTSSGIFQAVGDSKHPLYYLIISSITNVVLDLLFVAVLRYGNRRRRLRYRDLAVYQCLTWVLSVCPDWIQLYRVRLA